MTLTIDPEADGCVASIVHEMDAQWIEYVSQTESGWARMLNAVDKLLD